MNSLFVINPYKWNGQWVFDDPSRSLDKEALVAGIDTMLDHWVQKLGAGQKGLVTDILAAALERGAPDRIITCGPVGMMKAAAALAARAGVRCDVSLDSFMACGFGACMGCAVPVKNVEGKRYLHACADGPVFDSSVIDWEAL